MIEIIMNMVWFWKVLFNGKELLNGILFSFFYGVKIGVVGINGCGKIILFWIIVGEDMEF